MTELTFDLDRAAAVAAALAAVRAADSAAVDATVDAAGLAALAAQAVDIYNELWREAQDRRNDVYSVARGGDVDDTRSRGGLAAAACIRQRAAGACNRVAYVIAHAARRRADDLDGAAQAAYDALVSIITRVDDAVAHAALADLGVLAAAPHADSEVDSESAF